MLVIFGTCFHFCFVLKLMFLWFVVYFDLRNVFHFANARSQVYNTMISCKIKQRLPGRKSGLSDKCTLLSCFFFTRQKKNAKNSLTVQSLVTVLYMLIVIYMDKEAVYRYTNIKMTQKFWHSNDGNPISSKQQHRSLIFF